MALASAARTLIAHAIWKQNENVPPVDARDSEPGNSGTGGGLSPVGFSSDGTPPLETERGTGAISSGQAALDSVVQRVRTHETTAIR
jgi:hypothetical protein